MLAQKTSEQSSVSTTGASVFTREGEKGGYEVLRENFSETILGRSIPHTRTYRQKTVGDEVCFIITLAPDEDLSTEKPGFELICASLEYGVP